MTSHLTVSYREGYRRIAFDRPETRNAIDVATVEALLDELAAADEAILLSGTGPVTCAGADTSIVGSDDDAAKRALIAGINEVYEELIGHPRPTVMVVKGAAIGAGFQLAVCCDFAVAGEGAILSKPEIAYGVFSSYSTRMLKEAFGASVAREIALRGEEIPAERASEWGIVSDVVAEEAVEASAADLVDRLADYDPEAYASTKAALSYGASPDEFENYP